LESATAGATPNMVAAIIGFLLGARYRLHMCGVTAPKDLCDVEGWLQAISIFKKHHRFSLKVNYLDAMTMARLHELTDKSAQKLLGSRVWKPD